MLAALAEDGSPAAWHTDAGILSLDQSLPEQAESLLRKARSLGDDSARARRALAAVLIDLEKWADAETEAAELLSAHPGFVPAHDLLARIYAHSERIVEAAHHAGIYAEARPQSRGRNTSCFSTAARQPKTRSPRVPWRLRFHFPQIRQRSTAACSI